jgi:hypothetical protein
MRASAFYYPRRMRDVGEDCFLWKRDYNAVYVLLLVSIHIATQHFLVLGVQQQQQQLGSAMQQLCYTHCT